MYECDPSAQFNDTNLPDDLCDNIDSEIQYCVVNIATGWAVGGQLVRFEKFHSILHVKFYINRSWNFHPKLVTQLVGIFLLNII
jgi:hypothetical protein